MATYFFAMSSFAGLFLLLTEPDVPLWGKWLSIITLVAGAIGGLIAFVVIKVPDWLARREQRLINDAASRIRLHASNSAGTVAQIAASAGVAEATAEKALLNLEQQGFAHRTQQGGWYIR